MKEDKAFRNCVIGLLLLVVATYVNHFGNSFHFDDSHCIADNVYVRSLKNIPEIFKSAKAFSSLPFNQTYRPMLTTLYALDYAVGGLGSFFYHVPIFLFFLLQGYLMYLLIIKIFSYSSSNAYNKYFALFTTGWYMLATANADTINYISSSSDSISTFWVVAGLVLYVYKPQWRKYLLYLIPVIIGTLFKQSAIVFPALLAVYAFLFEGKNEEKVARKLWRTALATLPSLILCAGLYKLQAALTPATYITGGDPFKYIITQPFVILHYFFTFYFPFGLSADSDWGPLESIASTRFLVGTAFIALLVVLAFSLLKYKKYAPIVFGIAWFFIALLPSTLVPLAEVMNDHRAFFPYVGLVIASGWVCYLLWEKFSAAYAKAFKVAGVLILLLNAAGTFARNMVWRNEETLWQDVTIKSPGNGRGMMNYGLALLDKGDLNGADKYFTKTIEMMPYYPYAYENMAILKGLQKQYDVAEKDFGLALQYGGNIPVMHYYYARYLHERGKSDEAITQLKEAIQLSAGDIDSHYLLMQIYQEQERWPDLAAEANATLALLPGDATAEAYLRSSVGKKSKLQQAIEVIKQNPTVDNYIALSLQYYNQKDYADCIEACTEALKIKTYSYEAYNNIGSAYNMMGEWEKATAAFTKALKIKPDFQLAQNNYNFSLRQLALTDSTLNAVKNKPTVENYINLSLMYYQQNLFMKSIDACKEAIKINPNYALAYNNMCAAYNMLAMWDEAITAGETAMRLEPNNQLVKNNLAQARNGKASPKVN